MIDENSQSIKFRLKTPQEIILELSKNIQVMLY
jgi:hypothetical protein